LKIMANIPNLLSLAHLTVQDADPLQLIAAAAAGGFNAIGLRIVAPMPTDRIVPVTGDEAMLRAIEQRLADTGISILDAEAVWLYPDADVASYRPAFETAQRLGAKHFLVVGNDPDEARVTANFARFCELARPYGLKAMLEFIPYCHTRTVEDAHRVVSAAAQPNAGVLVDALHLSRSGGHPDDLRVLDPAWLSYCQICDARAVIPQPEGLRNEARTDRLYPGLGNLPIAALLDALPAGLPIGVEAPCLEYAGVAVTERGRLCGVATRGFLNTYYQRAAATSGRTS
jgi:sugar phosphate isomerase/epimerase